MALCPIPGFSIPASLKQVFGTKSPKESDTSDANTFVFDPSSSHGDDTPMTVTALTDDDIRASNKPLETNINLESLPDVQPEQLAKALEELVENSARNPEDVTQSIHMHPMVLFKIPWIDKLVPGLEKLAACYHIGNFVVIRETGKLKFESMPIYARIGMHLLFYGSLKVELLKNKTVGALLRDQSVKQGRIYDSLESVKSIPSFIRTYGISLDELLEPDVKKYSTFNEFFYRKLKPGARPIQHAEDSLSICSGADCRLVVYPTIDLAKQFWVKGSNFTVPNILNLPPDSAKVQSFAGGSVAIFRLAPQDYHRFHCPIDGVVGEIDNIEGQYYTVNPQAINQDFDVLTTNVRSVLYLTHTPTGKQIAFVAVGALLVGSVLWTKGAEKGSIVRRGEELGYFAYGGSTIVVLFPKGGIDFDEDLLNNSNKSLETLVKVGDSIGRTPGS
ncbi:hypothetical protein PQX77_015042 [Marasmius sp. AFHP31]|nr:hypothetical protein PQX77_015042 [Marasmius sp. AFHP31]